MMAGHGIIGWLVVGLIVGALAKLLTPGRDPGGWVVTIVIGIAGSLLAGWGGAHLFGWYEDGSAPGWIASIIGAVVLLAIYRLQFAETRWFEDLIVQRTDQQYVSINRQ